MRRFEAIVKGRVQGVGFRAFVAARGRQLGLRGWVKNQFDGSVKVEAEGADQPLEALLEALREGPSLARVDGVAVAWEEDDGRAPLPPFEIR